MGTTVRNTAYEVRPNIIEVSDLSLIKKEEGVIVYNKTDQKLYTTDGIVWTELGGLPANITDLTHGYYGMLSDFYFGGNATETIIGASDINQFVDVNLTMNSNGLFDTRPSDMFDAQPVGHSGTGETNSPIIFNLDGLTVKSFANFRASMAFVPNEDEGQLESRLLFNRHSGTTPSGDFSIEEVSLSMQNGADIDYVSEPMLSFFIGDTIDTNGLNDAGRCRFQIKSNVEGTLKLRALTWYINK